MILTSGGGMDGSAFTSALDRARSPSSPSTMLCFESDAFGLGHKSLNPSEGSDSNAVETADEKSHANDAAD
jgi:hypothetical protein